MVGKKIKEKYYFPTHGNSMKFKLSLFLSKVSLELSHAHLFTSVAAFVLQWQS